MTCMYVRCKLMLMHVSLDLDALVNLILIRIRNPGTAVLLVGHRRVAGSYKSSSCDH